MTGVTVARDVLDDVRATIDGCFADVARRIGRFEHFDRVWQTAAATATGGKLIRPHLVLCARRGFGGETDDSTVQIAAALELLHLSFLLHDDVIDGDTLRRGTPNLIARQHDVARASGIDETEAVRYGVSCAILVGDVLLASAHRLVAGIDEPPVRRRALQEVLDDAVLAAAVGEHADIRISLRGEADESAILRTMEQKTARYSFTAPLQMGALLGDAPAAAVTALGVIGATMGAAFQARDDVLGVFGDPQRTGKSTLSDLREGKITLLIAHARTHTAWNGVAHLFGDPGLDEQGAGLLRAAIERSGARQRTEAVIDGLLDETRMSMSRAPLPAPLVDDLERVLASATERTR